MNRAKFLAPWIPINSKGHLEDELSREVSDKHLLFGKKVHAIAKREDRDDVLFELIGENKYAITHLTWKGAKENSSEYPRTELFNNWTAVYERITRDNQEFNL